MTFIGFIISTCLYDGSRRWVTKRAEEQSQRKIIWNHEKLHRNKMLFGKLRSSEKQLII